MPIRVQGRRQFLQGSLALAALGLLAGCDRLPPTASRPTSMPRVGFLVVGSAGPDPLVEAFQQGLRDRGYVEDQSISIEYRYADGRPQRLPELATDLVGSHVDVIFAPGTVQALAAKQATATIPIVFANPGDPVGVGLIASLAHPGGNLTGLTTSNHELNAKRLQLLKEAIPTASHVAYLFNPEDPSNGMRPEELQAVARDLGITPLPLGVGESGSFESAFDTAARAGADALVCEASPFFGTRRSQIVALVAQHRLPSMFGQREFVVAGGLLSYAANFPDQYRRAATYVDKILKGAKPAELPVEQPTAFELVINQKTVETLGLTIPRAVLQQATEVIQ